MKQILMSLCVGGILMGACAGKSEQKTSVTHEADTLLMLVGSYAKADQEGVKVYRFNQETGDAVQASALSGIENPSYLVPDQDGTHVYAVGETEKGFTANALALDTLPASLSLVNSQSTGGASPCYITVSPDGRFVLTANYMGANITVFPRLANGSLGEGHAIAFQGKGADKERQDQPHLHCVYFTPDGKLLLANDLGTDRITIGKSKREIQKIKM